MGGVMVLIFKLPDQRIGQAEVQSWWPEGYGQMSVLDAMRVKK
jgi:hypothetical protein